MSPETLAILLAGITIVGNLSVSVINKRYEYKKSLHSVVMDCAYKEWEHKTRILAKEGEEHGSPVELVPFSDYVFFYSEFMKLIEKKKMTEKDIENYYKKYNKLYETLVKYRH